MGRIFISAGHGGYENGTIDPGAIAGGTTEAQEMILLRDMIVAELRSRRIEVLSVPDDLSMEQSISWINSRARTGDVALEIHLGAASTPATRGARAYHIANNTQRRQDAQNLLLALLRRVPQLPSQGVFADTMSGLGSLAFCRWVSIGSILMEVGYITSPDDRFLLQNRRRDFAIGIAEGLIAWSGATPAPTPTPTPTPTATATATYSPINININGQTYGEGGIIVNGNAFIPIDLVDSLGVNITQVTDIRRITYKNLVYIRAIELRDFSISVGWNADTRTVLLRSIVQICPGTLDRIMGHGNTSEVQLMMFLKSNNEAAINQFPDLAKIYREEGSIEGVNYDIAFCQMCLETDFLRFGNEITPNQNNFASLGGIGGTNQAASFSSARIGVRAHIQRLKAYASTEPLVQEVVDPRFRFVTRGVAPLVDQLSGRWSADLQYGRKIMALMRRLYESTGLI